MTSPTCTARISEPPHYIHDHACDRPAKFTRGGLPVCGIHARSRGVRLRFPNGVDEYVKSAAVKVDRWI